MGQMIIEPRYGELAGNLAAFSATARRGTGGLLFILRRDL